MINVEIDGKARLKNNWGDPSVRAILSKLQSITFNDNSSLDVRMFDKVLALSGRGEMSDFIAVKEVMNELNAHLAPYSYITTVHSSGEYTVRLNRSVSPQAGGIKLSLVEEVSSLSC